MNNYELDERLDTIKNNLLEILEHTTDSEEKSEILKFLEFLNKKKAKLIKTK